MDPVEGGKNEKKPEVVLPKWQKQRELVQKEHELLKKDIEDLNTWIDTVENMNDQQLKEYLQNCPADDSEMKGHKTVNKVKRAGNSKSSNSNGIMASVWKFHNKQ